MHIYFLHLPLQQRNKDKELRRMLINMKLFQFLNFSRQSALLFSEFYHLFTYCQTFTAAHGIHINLCTVDEITLVAIQLQLFAGCGNPEWINVNSLTHNNGRGLVEI